MQSIKQDLKRSGVYIILNKLNNHRYVGSSKNIYSRLLKHRSLLRAGKHENSHLQNAWNKYTESNFDYAVLEYCEIDKLYEREQFFIDTLSPEYNIAPRADSAGFISESMRKNMSISRITGIKSGSIPKTHNKPIFVYNKNGDFVGYWDSIRSACLALEIDYSCVQRVIKGEYTQTCGYKFFFEKQDVVAPFKKAKGGSTMPKKVFVFTSDDETLKFYGMEEAAKYFNVTIKTLRQYTTGRHKFKRKYYITSYLPCD